MPPAAVLRRQLGAGGLAVLLGAAGCWCRTSPNCRGGLPHGLLQCESQKENKKEKNNKQKKHEFSDENLHFGVDKIHGPKKAKKRSWDFPGR